MSLSKNVSLLKENRKSIICDMQTAKNHDDMAWLLKFGEFWIWSSLCFWDPVMAANFTAPAVVFTCTSRLSQRKMSSEGTVFLIWRFLRPFVSPSPPNLSNPAANMTTQPDVLDWHAHPDTTGQSQSPWGCPCPWHCDTWAQIPNVMSYLFTASKHPCEQETLTDGWKAFKKTPRQPGRCTQPCQCWWVLTYAQPKMPKGRLVPAPTESTESWFKRWVSAASHGVPFAFAKYLLNSRLLSLVPWTSHGPKR